MTEVTATLEFVTPCLGAIDDGTEIRKFLRVPATKQVIFMPVWWMKCLEFGFKALNQRWQRATEVQAAPEVQGTVSIYTRHYVNLGKPGTQLHEAFTIGSRIEVDFMLPTGMTTEEFKQVLSLSGRFSGLSPHGHFSEFGRFKVINIQAKDGYGGK